MRIFGLGGSRLHELLKVTRGCGLKRKGRVCRQCMQQEVKNEEHFRLQCGHVAEEGR